MSSVAAAEEADRWKPFLDSVHPGGTARHIRGLGGNAGAWRAARREADGQLADVILLAPTSAQCLAPGWLGAAVRSATQQLSSDGIIYAVAPPPWRARVAGLLHRQGLETRFPVAHFRGSIDARYYVPLGRAPLRYALDNLPIRKARLYKHVLKPLLTTAGGARLLATLLPAVGIPAFRRGSLPPFAWLLGCDRDAGAVGVIVITSWRGPAGAVVAFRFADDDRLPSVAAKISVATLSGADEEASRLVQLGPAAQAAGIRVPKMLDRLEHGRYTSLVETVIPGRPVALLLPRQPQQLSPVMDELVAWLERWNRSTISSNDLTPARREREILSPARTLLGELPGGPQYVDWITRRSAELVGRPVPWVATHNDLTMWNVLRADDGRLGVVDWEVAQPAGYPLSDFWYAVCDAVSVTDGYADRVDAFVDCFASTGQRRPLVNAYEERLRRSFSGVNDWIELCFHACWLQHAANERRQCTSGERRPFLAIAQALALKLEASAA